MDWWPVAFEFDPLPTAQPRRSSSSSSSEGSDAATFRAAGAKPKHAASAKQAEAASPPHPNSLQSRQDRQAEPRSAPSPTIRRQENPQCQRPQQFQGGCVASPASAQTSSPARTAPPPDDADCCRKPAQPPTAQRCRSAAAPQVRRKTPALQECRGPEHSSTAHASPPPTATNCPSEPAAAACAEALKKTTGRPDGSCASLAKRIKATTMSATKPATTPTRWRWRCSARPWPSPRSGNSRPLRTGSEEPARQQTGIAQRTHHRAVPLHQALLSLLEQNVAADAEGKTDDGSTQSMGPSRPDRRRARARHNRPGHPTPSPKWELRHTLPPHPRTDTHTAELQSPVGIVSLEGRARGQLT